MHEHEILSVPMINKSQLLSTHHNDWPYYASSALPSFYYFSLYYDRPELCFAQWPNIRERIFDQYNRSNLAGIIWYPFLCSDRNLSTEIWHCQLPNCGFETTSFRIDTLTSSIGGIIDMDYNLSPGRYIVTNDIIVRPDKRLTIQSSQLEFLNGIGMFVYGELIVQGVDGSPTRFDLYDNRTSTSVLVNQQKQQEQTQRQVMLIDGPSMYEGRLFVTSLTDGSGTVCNHGWTKDNTILVCLSMGMIHDPNDIHYPMMNMNQTRINDRIVWSEVKCDLYQDETLEQCRKETVHTCEHIDDVWIKCLPPSWSGIHIYPSYSRLHFEHVHIESTGQYDIHRDHTHAALHIDLYAHPSNLLKNVTFNRNILGLQIDFIHPAQVEQSIIHHSTFTHQYFAGVRLRSSAFNLSYCTFRDNDHAGLIFDGTFVYEQLEQFRINLHARQTTVHTIDLLYQQTYELERNRFAFLTSSFSGYHTDEHLLVNTLNIRTDPSFILLIDLIDYQPISNYDEQLIICEVECYQQRHSSTSLSYKTWSLAYDRDSFPLITSYASIQIHYRLRRYQTSRLTLIIYSVRAPTFASSDSLPIVSDIVIRAHRCLFSSNHHDIVYLLNDRETSNPLFVGKNNVEQDRLLDWIDIDEQRTSSTIDIQRRYRNASLYINECLFEFNRNRSIFVNHRSIKIDADQIEQTLRILTNETMYKRKHFLPVQWTCRIDKSIFLNNQQGKPYIYIYTIRWYFPMYSDMFKSIF
jgi:hypothetical protein